MSETLSDEETNLILSQINMEDLQNNSRLTMYLKRTQLSQLLAIMTTSCSVAMRWRGERNHPLVALVNASICETHKMTSFHRDLKCSLKCGYVELMES